MSVLGNPITSSVVAGMAQAPQAARARQQQDGHPQYEVRKVRETFESHMQALDESDSGDSATRLHVDAQLPEHQSPDGRKSRKRGKPAPENEASAQDFPPESPATAKADSGGDELYRHLDVVI